MPVIDILLLLGAGALVIAVAGWAAKKTDRKRQDQEAIKFGIANAESIKREQEKRCAGCDQLIDPTVDAYDPKWDQRWWCRSCWKKFFQ